MEYKIYCLKHPDNEEIKYIGCTTTSLNLRLSQHIWDSKNKQSKKSLWIKDLINDNKKPIIELLEICNEESWKEREIYYISKYFQLINTHRGGAGIVLNRLPESIRKSTEFRNVRICQFDLTGAYLKTWDSINTVEKELNILHTSIGNHLKNRSKSAGGFLWLYEFDYLDGKLPKIKNRKKARNISQMKVALLDSINGNIIQIFDSVKIASEQLQIPLKDISSCCGGFQKSAKGKYFKLL